MLKKSDGVVAQSKRRSLLGIICELTKRGSSKRQDSSKWQNHEQSPFRHRRLSRSPTNPISGQSARVGGEAMMVKKNPVPHDKESET
ncbi:hypothetical protein KIN20_001059 [Parelaphostrongylus tenuis]|uniref:Uncharacterized protein n=1 Tax=Parelaphostrongylus tenuis TaxID=148309 RepID=A0AAD5QGN9_PARTN|nr:hypothetical protein KIN20_001059 [Parelaphostrongylus tenuis]